MIQASYGGDINHGHKSSRQTHVSSAILLMVAAGLTQPPTIIEIARESMTLFLIRWARVPVRGGAGALGDWC